MITLLVAALSLALLTATFLAKKHTARTAKIRTTRHLQPIRERLRRLRRTP